MTCENCKRLEEKAKETLINYGKSVMMYENARQALEEKVKKLQKELYEITDIDSRDNPNGL